MLELGTSRGAVPGSMMMAIGTFSAIAAGVSNAYRLIGGRFAADIAGYISSGGRSSRFGSDKARALVGGQPMIQRIAQVLRCCFDSVTAVAAQAHAYRDLGIRTIADLSPGKGPMAALQAALVDRGQGWIFLVSCDLAGLQRRWISQLVRRRGPSSRAVAFCGPPWEPLCALYHVGILPEVERRIVAGCLSMQSLLDGLPAERVALPSDWPQACQVNTRQDLERLGTLLSLGI